MELGATQDAFLLPQLRRSATALHPYAENARSTCLPSTRRDGGRAVYWPWLHYQVRVGDDCPVRHGHGEYRRADVRFRQANQRGQLLGLRKPRRLLERDDPSVRTELYHSRRTVSL